MNTYRIVRMFFREQPNGRHRRQVNGMSGLTLEQAQAHCQDPETSSSTCHKAVNVRRTRMHGPWFDAYECEQS